MFKCMECGRKFKTVTAARKAAFGDHGCPKCGGSDIDLDDRVQPAKATDVYTGPRTYLITTVHPTGFKNGEHEVRVIRNPIVDDAPETRYVTGDSFGCSRDYTTPSDTVAINNLLTEHGMRVTKMVRVK